MARLPFRFRASVAHLVSWTVCVGCGLYGSVGLSQDIPSLEVLRALYAESATSIRTAEYVIELKEVDAGESPAVRQSSPRPDGTMVAQRIHVWADGRRVARLADSTTLSGYVVRSWFAFNGKSFAWWRHSVTARRGREQLPQGKISSSPPWWEISVTSLATLLGTWVFPDESLERLLARRGSRVIGREKVGGVDCVRVELAPYAAYRTAPDHPLRIIAWFDPSAGYLPRRIRTVDPTESDKLEWEYEVLEFQQVAAPDGKMLWVPRRGQQQVGASYPKWKIEISNVRVNHPIADAAFEPEFPVGTLVLDELANPSPRTFYAGGQAGEQRYHEILQTREAALEEIKAEQASFSAMRSATRASWQRWGGVAVGIALLAVGMWVAWSWFTRSRAHSD